MFFLLLYVHLVGVSNKNASPDTFCSTTPHDTRRDQSISSVDMSYDLGTKPNREAGPIERVVLQEGLDEDDDEDEDDEDDGDGVGEEGRPEGEGGVDMMLDMPGDGGREGVDGGGGGGVLTTEATTAAGVVDKSAGAINNNGASNKSAAAAAAAAIMAEVEAEVLDVTPSVAEAEEVSAMEAGHCRGEEAAASAAIAAEGNKRRVVDYSTPGVAAGGAEVVSWPQEDDEGADFASGKAKAGQQCQEAYWERGYEQVGSGAGAGTGWGSTIRPTLAPRLSVDLINVDPVKELVKTVSLVCLGCSISTNFMIYNIMRIVRSKFLVCVFLFHTTHVLPVSLS